MSSKVALPSFISASSTLKKSDSVDDALGQTTSSGDPLDFDLLAEYLLDDGAPTGDIGINFDFSAETPPLAQGDYSSSIVSPDQQAEVSFADPLADATERMRATATGPSGDLAGDLAQVQHMIATQAKAAEQRVGSKAPTPLARNGNTVPPPLYLNHPGAPMNRAGVPLTTALDSNKRRRVDVAAPVVAGSSVAPVMSANGLMIPPNIPRGGRQKSQAQIDRRRERNRILARRTRLRKKFFFESLQKDVTDLQHENALLKEIVRRRLKPELSKGILEKCKANEALPSIVAEQTSELNQRDSTFIQSVQNSQQCFIITDPSLQDNPIVYASDDFLTLTGYAREEVLGRNCRFLQGTETLQSKVVQLRKALANGDDCNVTMINYTSSGIPFWNNLFIAALRDAENNIVNFIGVIVKVASPEPDDPEYGKQLPGETSPTNMMDPNALNDAAAAAAAAKVAEGTVMELEGAVTAAVAAATSVNSAARSTP